MCSVATAQERWILMICFFKTNELLKNHPEVLNKYQHKFKYLMVDEYQDTNFSQYLIVKRLAAVNENICVVGDDAQSIYAFPWCQYPKHPEF
jgi:superfamily I DNA/RNA helicase